MSDPNAKLRTLRAWLSGDPEACPESGIRWCSMKGEPRLYNDEGNRVAWFVRTDVIAQIDRLLAEPEPRCTEEWVCGITRCRCTLPQGHGGSHFDNEAIARWERQRKSREPLPELVARLHGFVGPDGRGRP